MLKNSKLIEDIIPLFIALFVLQGCVKVTINEYEPLVINLDGKSELAISTYPSGFARTTSSIPFLYKTIESPNSVYFQVFVREAGKKAGKNPNINTITIRSFSYRFPADDFTELLKDYSNNFWMQGNSQYNSSISSPIPYDDHWYLYIKIDLTINGKDYLVEETLKANSRTSTQSLLLHEFSQ
ncbi:MAG: hypothetical protein HWE27_12055 [Gammaproteobacteria bacterium]|nr:hypothetical protein [Gammaproteobacteria bacterium]